MNIEEIPTRVEPGSETAARDPKDEMLDRWNPATDAPNQWNQANKSWRTNRHKPNNFTSLPSRSRRAQTNLNLNRRSPPGSGCQALTLAK
jgi:hypothetical protein